MQNWQIAEKIVYKYFSSKKDSYITRLSDTHDINAQLRRFGEKPMLLGKKKESDFLIVEGGYTYFAEVKCTTQIRGVTSSLFKSQEGKRDRVLRAGGIYKYFIYSAFKKSWYCVPGEFIYKKPMRKWEDLEEFKIDCLENVE